MSFSAGKMYVMFWSTPNWGQVNIKWPFYTKEQLAKQLPDFELNFNFMDHLMRATQSSNANE